MNDTNELRDKVLSIGEYLGANAKELWSELEPIITAQTQAARIDELYRSIKPQGTHDHYCIEKQYIDDRIEQLTSNKGQTTDNLLVKAIEISGNEFSMGYDDSGCFWRFYNGNRGAGSMMGNPVFHSESPEPLEALQEYIEQLIKADKKG